LDLRAGLFHQHVHQVLFMVAIVMVFAFAKRWLTKRGVDLGHRFFGNGPVLAVQHFRLSTMLLIVIFLSLAWGLALMDECTHDGKEDRKACLFRWRRSSVFWPAWRANALWVRLVDYPGAGVYCLLLPGGTAQSLA